MAAAATFTSLVSDVTTIIGLPPPTPLVAQGGVFEGLNPTDFNPSNPIILFIIQAVIIIGFCRLLQLPLSYLGQPRVVAEVIGGILLGPSAMMRIPGLQEAIFPAPSMPVLHNVANLGLLMYLFLVALGVDMRLFNRNWKAAAGVCLFAMLLPFGLGYAIAVGLYSQFDEHGTPLNISFGVYGFFIATSLSITAFSVLCRILPELKILNTSVGIIVLAAGIGNDITGWILLALCLSLVNNSSGLATLWAVLCMVGWILALVFLVRPAFRWLMRKTGSIQNGPTQGMVALTLMLILTSAWFTGIIGIHPVFGAFIIGLICPRDGDFAIKVTEKIEDLVSVLFLPLYFALSGLNTDLGLLDSGITWAYIVGLIAVAFVGNITGAAIAAHLNKLEWRESITIGVLMSCNGLMELVVLNIGLQSQILSQRTFTMLVVMALITTISTTPLTKLLYPPWYQKRLEKWRKGETDRNGNPLMSEFSSDRDSTDMLNDTQVSRRLLVYLSLESLPSIFMFVTLLGTQTGAPSPRPGTATTSITSDKGEATPGELDTEAHPPSPRRPPLEVYGLHIQPLTERASSIMRMREDGEPGASRDPVVNAFRIFSQMNGLTVSGRVATMPTHSFAEALVGQASDAKSDFVLVPWTEGNGGGSLSSVAENPSGASHPATTHDRHQSRASNEFIQQTLKLAVCNTGVFISNGFGSPGKGKLPSGGGNNGGEKAAAGPASRKGFVLNFAGSVASGLWAAWEPPARIATSTAPEPSPAPARRRDRPRTHRVFFPFFGGVDDRVALRFVMQLARNPAVTATVAHFEWPQEDYDSVTFPLEAVATVGAAAAFAGPSSSSSFPPPPLPPRRWSAAKRATGNVIEQVSAMDQALLATLRTALPADMAARVRFVEVDVASGEAVVAEAVAAARAAVGDLPGGGGGGGNAGDMVVVGRRHARLGDLPIDAGGPDLRTTVGAVAEQMVGGGVRAGILVIQAGGRGYDM